MINEASELTKSQSNVMMGRPSDFTKHLLAFENRRVQMVQAGGNPFEIAESQRDPDSSN